MELPAAFDVLVQHQLFQDLSNDVDLLEKQVFIASWVDYSCNKYGMGYTLTDGSVYMCKIVLSILAVDILAIDILAVVASQKLKKQLC